MSARSVVLVTILSCAPAGEDSSAAASAATICGVRITNSSERVRLVRTQRERRLQEKAVRRVRLWRPGRGAWREPLVPQHELRELAGEPFEIPRTGVQSCPGVE